MEINHKGSWCNIKHWVFCQEGTCVDCEILREWEEKLVDIEELDGLPT